MNPEDFRGQLLPRERPLTLLGGVLKMGVALAVVGVFLAWYLGWHG